MHKAILSTKISKQNFAMLVNICKPFFLYKIFLISVEKKRRHENFKMKKKKIFFSYTQTQLYFFWGNCCC